MIVGQLERSEGQCFPTGGTHPSGEMWGLGNSNTRETEINIILIKRGHLKKDSSAFTKLGLNLSNKMISDAHKNIIL
jgi:hypothetical protein